jgi:hypothetical protein
MKKLFLIILASSFLVMCKSAKTAAATEEKEVKRPEVQYRDDFRSATDREKNALLKKLSASDSRYSVLVFTQNYKGERITASNAKGRFYSGYAISNLKTGIADRIRIDNSLDTTVHDKSDNHEIVIEAKEAQKHKYIYVMKNPGGKNPFTVTYSNTLRPLEDK